MDSRTVIRAEGGKVRSEQKPVASREPIDIRQRRFENVASLV